MHINDIFDRCRTTASFEFFPPKTPEGANELFSHIADLTPLKPSFVSVTYGAGGSTRELTHNLVVRIKETTPLDPIPHLTCVCSKESEIQQILERYAQHGVSNILALGGDPPRDLKGYERAEDAFQHAADLVRYIKRFNERGMTHDKRGFGIGVAGFPEGHPATPNRLLEMDHLKAKVDAGADYIVTQLFFDNRDFLDFRERCELAGIKVPIIAGIMPITSAAGLRRMAELAAGARFPARLLRAVQRAANSDASASGSSSGATATAGAPATASGEAVRRVGIHWASEQCRDLLDNQVRGIHFYTLNRSDATRKIYESLGITDSTAVH